MMKMPKITIHNLLHLAIFFVAVSVIIGTIGGVIIFTLPSKDVPKVVIEPTPISIMVAPIPTPTPTIFDMGSTLYILSVGEAGPTPTLPPPSWRLEFVLRPEGGGSIELFPTTKEQLYQRGSSVMAKANCDTEFERWAGEIPEGAVLKDNSIAFIVTKPQTLY